ncbi:MAG: metal ABC transporter ATP-binding protein, partial [Candidatus Eremiobacteraeota bacterium]|nr:metal ABC transporter ATP-binding protein [Candidatus Eremiobacteraeota bacterium]
KTTLLRALMGILAPQSGAVQYLEDKTRLRFGYVPQRLELDELFPLRVEDLVMMGRYPSLSPWQRPGAADRERVEACVARVGLSDRLHEPVRNLSGGQKQRVLMARALACEPDILFLDEPTNGMDLDSEEGIMDLVASFHAEGLTVVLVTHLLALVARHCHRVAILHEGLTVGKAEEVLTGERLTAIYGRPVEVTEVKGRRVVLPV